MIDLNSFKIINEVEKKMMAARNKIALLTTSIDTNNVDKTLKKGFALIKQNAKFVTRKNNYNQQDTAIIKFYDGELEIK